MWAMLSRQFQNFVNHNEIILQRFSICLSDKVTNSWTSFSTSSVRHSKCSPIPRKLHKQERKPFITDVNELKRKGRLERQMRQEVCEITLKSPDNGLLVKKLIPVAHEVYASRIELFECVSKIIGSIPVHSCSCGEVHVGHMPHKIQTCNTAGSLSSKEHNWVKGGIEHVLPVVESFHLYDRVGRAVSHEERLKVDRIPAILELCVQAGIDIPEYPTRRRVFPVYSISGKLIDFEKRFPRDVPWGNDIQAFGFWEKTQKTKDKRAPCSLFASNLQGLAVRGMNAWERLQTGALKLMEKYPVQTCGFCPEVQVGPKGHRARICQAYKHQLRDGQHAWQEASIDDLIPPVYVWHVQDPQRGGQLVHGLKRYYGKLPAAVELFSQAGAPLGDNYAGQMRVDVAVPDLDEEKLVV